MRQLYSTCTHQLCTRTRQTIYCQTTSSCAECLPKIHPAVQMVTSSRAMTKDRHYRLSLVHLPCFHSFAFHVCIGPPFEHAQDQAPIMHKSNQIIPTLLEQHKVAQLQLLTSLQLLPVQTTTPSLLSQIHFNTTLTFLNSLQHIGRVWGFGPKTPPNVLK